MSKRKREDDSEEGDEVGNLDLTVSRLKARIRQGVQSLQEALKLARGFERQKLGRRQKNAASEPQTLLRLREEVIVLKQLQLEPTSRNYLVKSLAKTKRVKEHAAFVDAFGTDPTLEQIKPGAEANVIGRLFNSNPVKQVVPQIMDNIFAVLKIAKTSSDDSSLVARLSSSTTKRSFIPAVDDDFSGFSDEEVNSHEADEFEIAPDSDSAPDLDDLRASAANRIADSEDGSTDENDNLLSRFSRDNGARRKEPQPSGEADTSMSLSLSEGSDSDEDRRHTSPARKPPSSTAFLPSLSMGGYYSGSESDDDTNPNPYRGPAEPKPRNNRRGQRARQQIAEKKFGKNAKHLGKQTGPNGISVSWDAKKGAVIKNDHPRTRTNRGQFDGRRSERKVDGGQEPTTKPRKSSSRDDQGPVHPSWEAARKRKMQDQSQAAFQGKKITFD